MRLSLSALMMALFLSPTVAAPPTSYPTTIDLDGDAERQVVVDREAGQYLGHPTTCLLEDGRTMLCVYPKGHGRGAIVYKRSTDGGRTWSDRLTTPASWATSKEVPTLHRVIGPDGTRRIIMWSGLYPARLAVSEDDGNSWSELEPVGDWGGIVVMGFVHALRTGRGHYLAMFHDDGRFFTADGKKSPEFKLFKTFSTDGGLTWSFPQVVYQSAEVHLCEPGCIRSPDRKRLAVLLRENSRRKNSHVIFSDDEGQTWTEPRELPLSLTGDRHTGKYGPDGRLFISFRCRSPKQAAADRPFEGDWVGWVGTWDDLVAGREGQYSVRLKDNTKGYDTTYPGVELLPDGTFVTTTYGHWDEGEQPYILSVRFKLEELDALASGGKQPASGFVSLFNGRDLTGWDGMPGAWTVSDGAIQCVGNKEGKRNWLIWRGGHLADFELRLKFRFTSGNSGVQVRSKDEGEYQVRGYQVEIASADKMGLWHHSLSPEKYRSHLATAGQRGRVSKSGEKTHQQFAEAAEVQKACQDGKWNQLVILADGPKLVQIINGVVLAELIDEDAKYAARSGVLALQDHGRGTVAEFKDILLKQK